MEEHKGTVLLCSCKPSHPLTEEHKGTVPLCRSDRYDIAKEYIDSIIKPKSFAQTSYGKFLRVISVTALSIGGGLLAGPIGAIPGAIVGGLTDMGIGLLDSYILDNIIKGWSPRYYIDKQIRPITKK